MSIKDRTIEDVSDLIKFLKQDYKNEAVVWFRGQADLGWKLIPSIARRNNLVDAEITLIKRFMQNALPFSPKRPSTEWEWLFLMQHHGLPTRLLDWTESPLVGLYFTVNELPKKDGSLWCLFPTKLNANANISYGFASEIPCFDQDDTLENYLPKKLASERSTKLHPIAAMALRDNPRIYAQLGTFTITHRVQTPIENIGDKKHIWRYIVPANKKKHIKEQLSYLRFTKLTLFPELDNVALLAKEVII